MLETMKNQHSYVGFLFCLKRPLYALSKYSVYIAVSKK
ncbi:hypothetical protein [uncultured Gammaproteobacteria bacterium]|nr:hypothetical protein BROOK1789B_2085 [Bathymodiolus brooksi thiotrophic gill symbiont]CAB9543012.1 hypothetical protein BROOK1789C_632 [Bathymodiolus brooksi thiotrophic gill symbiont]CAC9551495.1 hypothetical protein [uncultured Gammaproteobacteria bacterium]CAC9617219.1 hypothetical protein [uncultured Gammaproteobacteria bacterium]CAC9967476.1 hypothetical protein [uncultured Gammaproteobacteria bacterium]